MKKILNYISQSGVHDDMPEYLQRRVTVSNIVGLLIGISVGMVFSLLVVIFYPHPLLYIWPMIGFVLSTPTFLINRFLRWYDFTRLQIAFVPCILVNMYNAYLTGDGEMAYTGYKMVGTAFGMLPFIVFAFQERTKLIISLIIVAICLIGLDWYQGFFHLDIDALGFDKDNSRVGFLYYVGAVVSTISAFGCTFVLVNYNALAETKTVALLDEAKQRNEQIKASELELRNSLDQLKTAQTAERKRQWQAEGIATINQIIRTSNASTNVFDSLIAFLVKYIKANQGAIFTVDKAENDEDSSLNLSATYAYGRKKFIKKAIPAGDGLVGQVYLEKETTIYHEVPEGYLQIASGLGKAQPKSLIIIPCLDNEEVFGIVEIASFHDLEEHQIEFLNKAAENMASFIYNTQVNERTKVLLGQSIQQAEEMRAQEEEMRQNAEEMQATQEEMHRKEQEYVVQIRELESHLQSLQTEKS